MQIVNRFEDMTLSASIVYLSEGFFEGARIAILNHPFDLAVMQEKQVPAKRSETNRKIHEGIPCRAEELAHPG